MDNPWCKFFLNVLRSLAVEADSAPSALPVAVRACRGGGWIAEPVQPGLGLFVSAGVIFAPNAFSVI